MITKNKNPKSRIRFGDIDPEYKSRKISDKDKNNKDKKNDKVDMIRVKNNDENGGTWQFKVEGIMFLDSQH